MMKRIIFIFFVLAMMSITACKSGSDADTEDPCTNDPTLPECGTTIE
ncbi:MAG: hypothetical protein IKS02_07790 [Fibrobacter sp.]|nr:hypothetical protein [Fibrobacter sp.]